MSLSRRRFLQAAAALSATLWLPRRSRSAPAPSIKRVIIVHTPGGVRWTASFDAQSDVKLNPWGLLPWSLVGRGQAPAWGFSRSLVQKPLWQNVTDWSGHILPYLTSNDPASFHTAQTALPSWQNALLPSIADLSGRIAVVRANGNPNGPFDFDHGTANRTLFTGSRTGEVGIVTVFNDALRRQLGGGFDSAYPLPSVTITQPGWSVGTGEFAASRPIFLTSATDLPTADPGQAAAQWARQAESELDALFAASRPSLAGQAAADFINDKANADLHVPQLMQPALRLAERPAGPSPALGTLTDGETPLTNDMLAEAFGLSSDSTAAGDYWFDIFAGAQSNAQPSWTAGTNPFGLNGALAVRLLQSGAPVVSITVGAFDTHSYEVIDPSEGRSMSTQIASLGRLFAGLAFVLQRVADPTQPGASLWDSTVILTCSEFGRDGVLLTDIGFNTPDGSNYGGSDHDPRSAWLLFGGPVTAGGQLIGAASGDGYLQQNRLFTTLLQGMGIDDGNQPYLPYGSFPPIGGLVNGV
jgi:uncharacterized protein (DUF1501 family)